MIDEYREGNYWLQSVDKFELHLYNLSSVPDLNKFTKPSYVTLREMYEHLDQVLEQSIYYEPLQEEEEISSESQSNQNTPVGKK